MAKAKPQTRADAAKQRRKLVADRTGASRKPVPGEGLTPAEAIAKGRRLIAEKAKAPAPGERLARALKLFGKPQLAWSAPVVAETPPPPSAGEGGVARIGAKPGHDRAAVPLAETANHRGIWSPELVSLVVRLWTEEGATLGAIAEAVSAAVGRPVTRQSVVGKVERLGLVGKGRRAVGSGKPKVEAAPAAPATKPDKRADLSTGGGDRKAPAEPKAAVEQSVEVVTCEHAQNRKLTENACLSAAKPTRNITENITRPAPTIVAEEINTRPEPAMSVFAASSEVEKTDTRPAPDVVALFGVPRTERVIRQPGTYRIDELGHGQCRYSCNDAPKGGVHLFCGVRTRVQPGNLDGSWCDEHLAVVWSVGSSWNARKRA